MSATGEPFRRGVRQRGCHDYNKGDLSAWKSPRREKSVAHGSFLPFGNKGGRRPVQGRPAFVDARKTIGCRELLSISKRVYLNTRNEERRGKRGPAVLQTEKWS